MDYYDFTPGQEEAQRRVSALLEEVSALLGPDDDGRTEWEPGEAPQGRLTLWDSVMVCTWRDEQGGSYSTVLPGHSGMMKHHVVGLLKLALESEVRGAIEDD